MYYFFTNYKLIRSAVAWSWKTPEFYYFCFVVPVFEEVLFRGIILINLLNTFPILKYEEPLVMVSSLLFSLFHFNYDRSFKFNKDYVSGLVLLFIWGNAIGYLVLLTG
nr:CPBP family intramembrane glutamic endopeptidase [Clostridium algidicarnis]